MTTEIISIDNNLSFIEDGLLFRRLVNEMSQAALELVVSSEQSFKQATSIWKQARDFKKTVEAQRKSLCEPERKKITSINDRAKDITEPLDVIENTIKQKIDLYSKKLEQDRAEFIQQQKEAAEMIGVSFDVYVPELSTSKRGDGAIAYKKTKKNIEVSDINLIPKKYLTVNMKLVEEDMKAGMDIPGIKVTEEEVLQLRSR